jgi:hypothetical protein
MNPQESLGRLIDWLVRRPGNVGDKVAALVELQRLVEALGRDDLAEVVQATLDGVDAAEG